MYEIQDLLTTGAKRHSLMQVAAGAADLYTDELQQTPFLSPQGSQQLAADLEYFCNVLSALGVAIPSRLGTWQVAVQWSSDDFPEASRAALDDGMVDSATLQIVARIRQLTIQSSS